MDDQAGIIAGHGRLEAAKSLAMDKVPVVKLTGLSEKLKRAYLDSALRRVPEVYFEAGDHELLFKVSDAEFSKLQASATEAKISHHM